MLLDFPSRQATVDWFDDAEYQEAAELRRTAAVGRLLLIDGEDGCPG